MNAIKFGYGSHGCTTIQMIAFNPAMDVKKVEAIHSIGFPKGFKIALKFSEKFYPDVINLKGIGGENIYCDIALKKRQLPHPWLFMFRRTGKIYDALVLKRRS